MAKSLLRATATVGGMTMVSRVLGFIRDVIVARVFGADAGTDAFFVAFRIPNFLRRLFAEGAFSQAFVPVLSEFKEKQDQQHLRELVDRVAGTLGAILLLVTVIGVIAAPLLIFIFGPGFVDEPRKFDMAAEMLRITFPYILFISMTAFAAGILNSHGQFAAPALNPVLLNLAMIGAALWLAPLMEVPIEALAWGVFIAGVAQLLFLMPHLYRLGLLPRPRWGWRHEGVQRILKLMVPAIFGSSVAQINLLINTILASLLVTGSISWLYYSDRLVELPLGVFGVALGTVILPKLSRDHANTSTEEFSATLDWALRWTLLIATPATLGLMLLAAPLLATLFYGGAFTAHDVRMASLSLMTYSFGLLSFMLVKVLAPGFYARQDTKTPVKVGLISMATNMGLNAALVIPMLLFAIPGAHAALALATSLAGFVNAGLLYRRLRRDGVYLPGRNWGLVLMRVAAANAALAAVLIFGPAKLDVWLQWDTLTRAWHLAAWVGAGMAVYFATLAALGVRLRSFKRG